MLLKNVKALGYKHRMAEFFGDHLITTKRSESIGVIDFVTSCYESFRIGGEGPEVLGKFT